MNVMRRGKYVFIFLCVSRVFQSVHAQEIYLERPLGFASLANGHILIADGGGIDWTNNGSRILELDEENTIIWQYKDGLVFPHSVQLLPEEKVLISDTTNNRVIIIDKQTMAIMWTTETISDLELRYPNNAQFTNDGTILITDRNNDRFIEISMQGNTMFEYTGLNRPHGAKKTPDGKYLVSDSEGNRVLVIDSTKNIVWEYSSSLHWPRDIDMLSNGNVLITDSRNHRVIEVDNGKNIVWQYSSDLYWPYASERLENGITRISDSQQKRIIDVGQDGTIVHVYELRRPEDVTNVLVNGGFEQSAEYANDCFHHAEFTSAASPAVDCNLLVQSIAPIGWHPGVLHAEYDAVLSLDSQDAYAGKYASKIANIGNSLVFWQTKLSVSPGKAYAVSGFLKREGSGQVRYAIIWENDHGGFIGEPVLTESIPVGLWTKRHVRVQAPENATYMNIRALIQGSGSAWFDDVSVQLIIPSNYTSIFATMIGVAVGSTAVYMVVGKRT